MKKSVSLTAGDILDIVVRLCLCGSIFYDVVACHWSPSPLSQFMLAVVAFEALAALLSLFLNGAGAWLLRGFCYLGWSLFGVYGIFVAEYFWLSLAVALLCCGAFLYILTVFFAHWCGGSLDALNTVGQGVYTPKRLQKRGDTTLSPIKFEGGCTYEKEHEAVQAADAGL